MHRIPDTDGDGLDDQFEATGGGGTLQWPLGGGEAYTTSPCAFDTDNDGLEDGEEVIIGKDGFLLMLIILILMEMV